MFLMTDTAGERTCNLAYVVDCPEPQRDLLHGELGLGDHLSHLSDLCQLIGIDCGVLHIVLGQGRDDVLEYVRVALPDSVHCAVKLRYQEAYLPVRQLNLGFQRGRSLDGASEPAKEAGALVLLLPVGCKAHAGALHAPDFQYTVGSKRSASLKKNC